jgi:molybdopterin-guanine dinucleotide biosynthesis protein A
VTRSSPTRTGLLLAGGRSTRFGEPDKAFAALAGAPLVRHAAAALAPAVDELVVNCRADQRDALASALDDVDVPLRFAVDPVPDEGPVAGLLTGLRVVRGRSVAVVGCDQPFLRPATVTSLFDRATGDAAAPTGAAPLVEGRRQPLGAVYPTARAREAAERTLAAGSRALRDVLARVDPTAVPVPAAAIRDIDTQAELADVLTELADAPGGEPTDETPDSEHMTPTNDPESPTPNSPPAEIAPLTDGGATTDGGEP